MNRKLALTILALLAAVSLAGAGVPQPISPLASHAGLLDPVGATADYAVLDVGSPAPDFSFECQGRSLRLHDLRAQGHVLLVFAPADDQLAAIEKERTKLAASGIVPVAVLDERSGACSATVRRLGLGYSVIPDPRRVIGAQFNAIDPTSRADAAAWFVLDRSGKVRDLAHGDWPGRPWTEVTARALGLPTGDAVAPASFRRH